ncbi:MAG: phosphate ABC transporter permease PstA [Acidimicrobiales bacterium]
MSEVRPVLPVANGGGAHDAAPGDGTGRESTLHRRKIIRVTALRSLRRRRLNGRIAETFCVLAVMVGLVPLVALLYYTIARGAKVISFGFLFHAPTPPGVPGGGISTAIEGSAKIAGLALLIAVPFGLFVALYLYERRGRLAGAIRFSADVLTGVPSIVIGIFAYALLVRPLHHPSDLAASFALVVLMLPIIIRADEEAMRTVAVDLWEAGLALGVRRSRVARSVVLRGALPGLATGNLLALARGVGETAPLLFTVAAPTFALTYFTFSQGAQAFTAAQQAAWGTAFVLLVLVLLLSVGARVVAWRLTRNAR